MNQCMFGGYIQIHKQVLLTFDHYLSKLEKKVLDFIVLKNLIKAINR